mmetsp:Transcript_6393/g.14215  ORF Transcript_6393/g.14215 Transcript_6393/m.14215 type:complete len:211 (+) Transcript_6393:177-809(+)|eukprot:CAMPEP_0202894196 /NCGR_PEP_ID=MMETSP1392-20130828/3636_1 /ASSEMBLY_ACC=CAM_ASM_000868 /TAXON_ID=225041 /ORGANISM="Chlamydomonas chlamydogama, Strain SAG 11-48b" /LENGTH=210 /DNA_ID=CAMNT_0049578803 /DNA_START=161 /DNA_END=793 /DNA_ORIENTATION=-
MENYRIKFVSAEADLLIALQPGDRCDVVAQKVRQHKQLPPTKHVRIICAGKELYPDDLVSSASAKVFHCIITDNVPQRPAENSKPEPPPAPPEPPPVDWLDMVDPGTVLMWIFGSILAVLWLLYIVFAHMFDRTSLVILSMMTVAFLIPCVLSYLPWPTFLQPHVRPYQPGIYDPAMGQSTALYPGGAYARHPHSGAIPPRPPARVRPAS